jgi:hypothetical protein
LPWVYARRRIENCVDRVVGQRTVPLDDELAAGLEASPVDGGPLWSGGSADGVAGGGAGGGGHASMSDVFARLVAIDDRCRLLRDALDAASVSDADREVCFQYAVEQGAGNRSPATTVGTAVGLGDAAVRQRVHRSRRRLRAVAAADDRYAPLADLALLA